MEVLKQNLEGHLHTYKYIQTEAEALLKHVLNQGMSYFKGCWTRYPHLTFYREKWWQNVIYLILNKSQRFNQSLSYWQPY